MLKNISQKIKNVINYSNIVKDKKRHKINIMRLWPARSRRKQTSALFINTTEKR